MSILRRFEPARAPISRWAPAGMMVRATMTDAMRANVFVNASGLKRLPKSPVKKNTGRKPTMVVATAVSTALPTSVVAR